MDTNKTQILIVYDRQIIAEGLVATITKEKKFDVLKTIPNIDFNIEKISQMHPDIIIFEFDCIHQNHIFLFQQLAELFPNIRTLVISELLCNDYLVKIMSFVNGYVVNTCSTIDFISALHDILVVGKYLSPEEVKELFKPTEKTDDIKLTERENDVLSAWLLSSDNNSIAEELNISASTVRTHLKNIRQKIGNTNRIKMLTSFCKNNIMQRGGKPICVNCKYSS